MIGPEHEFSINDEQFNAVPISDEIIKKIRGRMANEAVLGRVVIGKELQKHVIEIKPTSPFESLSEFEEVIQEGVEELLSIIDGYKLLGLGMHPLLKLDDAEVWNHRDRRIYEAYDRLFNIKQHGWLNIQSYQLNVPYSSEKEAVELHNKIRVLLPYIAAIDSASPLCEGKPYFVDTRLHFYRTNQREIPAICNDVIPERISSLKEYRRILNGIYEELRRREAYVLCREWVNSRGVIVRFSRKCLEIKVMDEQECVKSDVALTAFIRAILRAELEELPRDMLIEKLNSAMKSGTEKLKPELKELLKRAREHADEEERKYMKVVKQRVEEGSLGERILMNLPEISEEEIISLCEELSRCLERNEVYI